MKHGRASGAMSTLPKSATILLALSTALALAALPVQAAHNNQGTVKVHDNESENPPQRNVPHVSCDFWIEGFKMSDDSGWIRFFGWPPTGDKSEVTPTSGAAELNWNADSGDESGEFRFLAGPFRLDPGHYRVEVFTHDGHPGGDSGRFAKAKTFWVEPCNAVPPVVNPPCPLILDVKATSDDGDARITLTWSAVATADAYVVYRASGGSDFEAIGEVAGGTMAFVDDDVTVGTTYEYYVTAVIDQVESVSCETVEASAIPFFPGFIAGAIAITGSVGAYAWLRRKA